MITNSNRKSEAKETDKDEESNFVCLLCEMSRPIDKTIYCQFVTRVKFRIGQDRAISECYLH